jgi:hypothetical protein
VPAPPPELPAGFEGAFGAGLTAAAGLLGALAWGFFSWATANTDTARKSMENNRPRTRSLLPSFQLIIALLGKSPIIAKIKKTRPALDSLSDVL